MLTKQNNQTEITFQDMRSLLQQNKRWEVSQNGNEFLFTFKLIKYPIEIKVLSGIDVKTGHSIPQKPIRIYSIANIGTGNNGKTIFQGLVSTKNNTIQRTMNWRNSLQTKIMDVLNYSTTVYQKKYQYGI